MHLNQKDLRIKKLYEKGIRHPADIAKKIGYGGKSIDEGIIRVKEGLARVYPPKQSYERQA